VHHQARRLVDHQDVVVFIDDVQLDVLGDPFALGFLLGSQLKNGATMNDVSRADDRPSTVRRPSLIQAERRERECSANNWAAT
jgi:hypothetical protein